jgi:cobalt-zinc-cadmium efflux system protein
MSHAHHHHGEEDGCRHDAHETRAGGGHHHHHHRQAGAAAQAGVFAVAIALNAVFVAVEFGFGFAANSSALMADAGHNLSDVLGLLLAWGATVLARRRPSGRFTYGLRGASILATLGNAMLLLLACGVIGWEAVHRLARPAEVSAAVVSIVAAAGIVVNGLSAWILAKGSKGDLNMRGAYLHMAADAAVSVGVVIAGLLMLWTGWSWVDPVLSLAIVAVIVYGTWGLLREAVGLSLDAAPAHISLADVEACLRAQPGVLEVQDLHVWAVSTTETALTAHLVIPEGPAHDQRIDAMARVLRERFAIGHSTLQIARGTLGHGCPLGAENPGAAPTR